MELKISEDVDHRMQIILQVKTEHQLNQRSVDQQTALHAGAAPFRIHTTAEQPERAAPFTILNPCLKVCLHKGQQWLSHLKTFLSLLEVSRWRALL